MTSLNGYFRKIFLFIILVLLATPITPVLSASPSTQDNEIIAMGRGGGRGGHGGFSGRHGGFNGGARFGGRNFGGFRGRHGWQGGWRGNRHFHNRRPFITVGLTMLLD